MARIDDYRHALELGREALSGKDPDRVAHFSGALTHRDSRGNTFLSLLFLNRPVRIAWPRLEVTYEGSPGEMPIEQRVLLLHYLQGSSASGGPAITGEWISYQEVPDGKFYLDAFHRRAKDPMVRAFGARPELLLELAREAYGALSSDQGDVSVVVKALPLVPVHLIIWRGDEEFPPEGNILFDRNILQIFSAEDVAWLSGMIIYPLIGMAKR